MGGRLQPLNGDQELASGRAVAITNEGFQE
jgi:hypothetical protein